MNHSYKLQFDNTFIVNIDGKKYEFKNKLTADAEKILAKNMISFINTNSESNKIFGIILYTEKITIHKDLKVSDLMADASKYVILPLNSITYLGTGTIKYGARYNFTYLNNSGTAKTFKVAGLITGIDINHPDSFKLFSVLSCSFVVNSGSSLTSDYLMSASIKR